MHRLLIIVLIPFLLIVTALLGAVASGYVASEASIKNAESFTGYAFRLYPNYFPRKLVKLRQGLRDGVELTWYSNGQLWTKKSFKDGVLDGKNRSWFNDGRVQSQREYKVGVDVGEYWAWHHNGQLAYFVAYKNGKEVAYKSWSAFGKPFYNYLWQDGEKIGIKGGSFCKPRKIL